MELRHLIYFEAVARHQHVSRAAEELSIAQPAITKQIHDLERELGAGPLFARVGRHLRLTGPGQAFLVHVRGILAQVDAARAEMRERGELRQGQVTIGTPPTVGLRLLPEALAVFHQRYPALELRIREGSTQALLTLIEAGEVDLAVVTLPVTRRGLWATRLFDEELVVVASLDHPLADRKAIDFGELADEPFLFYPVGYEMREVTLAACKQAGFTPRVVLDGGDMDMLLRLAEVGLGIALMPPLALSGGERLAILRVRDQTLRRTMGFVSHDERTLTPAALALRDFLARRLAHGK
jgi:DNA-binding transcriptional LysR family regulator